MKDYHRFYASFNRLPCNGDRDDMKEILVSSFTDGRTTHLHEMTQKEYDAMWNDLRQSEALLDQNKLVRSLMQGYMDWDTKEQSETGDEKLYLPISVDDSQLQAMEASAVAVGAMNFHDPCLTQKVVDGMEQYLVRHNIMTVRELTGAVI